MARECPILAWQRGFSSLTMLRVQGEQYFHCRQNYGIFVKPSAVKVGNFPVEEIDLDEEM